MTVARRLLSYATALLLGCSGGPTGADAPDGAKPWLSIRGARVVLELARSPAVQTQGLSDRRELAWGRGMLFQYPTPRFQRFWMRRMHFAIDMVWIRDGTLIDISHRVPPPAPGTSASQLEKYGPRELVDTVLEVPAGFAEAHGWRRGDRVELSPDAEL